MHSDVCLVDAILDDNTLILKAYKTIISIFLDAALKSSLQKNWWAAEGYKKIGGQPKATAQFFKVYISYHISYII